MPEVWQFSNVVESDGLSGLHGCRVDAEKVSL